MMEPFSNPREDGVDDSRASVDGKRVVIESDERILRVTDDEVSGSGFVNDRNIRANLLGSGLGLNVSEVGELPGIDLVVDLNCFSTTQADHDGIKSNEKQSNSVAFAEKEGECEFSESEKVYLKPKSQFIINLGIKKESSRIDGRDRFSTVDSFNPAKIVDFLQDLGKDPLGFSRLAVSTVGDQLSAFNRWKGYHQTQLNEYLDKSDNSMLKKGKSNTRGRPRKHKHLFDGDSRPSKKVKCLSDLMSNGDEHVSDDEYKPKKRGRKRKIIESNESSEQIQSEVQNEFLSQICLVAKNPIEKHLNLDSLLQFSSGFRNYGLETNVDVTETIEMTGFAGIKDSYWTDRIIVTKSDEEISPDFISKPNKESSATALILKFTNLDSVPSITKLNEIFMRYGALQETETRILKKNKCVKVVFENRCDAETAFSSSGKFSIFGPALVSYRLDFSPTLRKNGETV